MDSAEASRSAPPARRGHLRHRRKRRGGRRGVALVMVLGAITVLTVFLTELQEETSSQLSAALAERDAVRAEYYARSAINLSRLLIAMEPKIFASLPILKMLKLKQLPVWKYQDMVLGPFNDASGNESFANLIKADPTTGKNLGIAGGGHFELTIVDEDSKININAAAKSLSSALEPLARQLWGLMGSPEYNPLFEGRDLDDQFSDRQTICGALLDWADSAPTGNEELFPCDLSTTNTTTGSEDNFYQTIGLGYRRKNAAYDSLEELRLVRGIGDDFWATFVDPDPTNPDKRLLTVWGQGKINMLTANAQTIFAVLCSDQALRDTFCVDPTQALPFLQLMSMAQAFLPPGVPIFGSGKDLTTFIESGGQGGNPSDIGAMARQMLMSTLGVTLKPVKLANAGLVNAQFGNTSKIFSMYAVGVVPGYKRTTKVRIHAVVDFRLAQGIGEAFGQVPGQGGTNPPAQPQAGGGRTLQAPGSSANNALPGSMPPAAYDALVRSNPAGTVIYWRVE